jgi:hypothetical protein
MTTLHEWQMTDTESERGETSSLKMAGPGTGRERRAYRRHDLEAFQINVDRWDGRGGARKVTFGRLVDLSAGGIRIRTPEQAIHADQQIRVRLELPTFAGICPFVDTRCGQPQPSRSWVGWLAVSRVRRISDLECEVAGRLVDMDDMDRGMLSLYLSTQPIAA